MHKLLCCIFLFLSLFHASTTATPIDQSGSTPIINPQCKQFFKAVGDGDNSNPQIKQDKAILAQNSGHNINDLGNYGSCSSNSSYKYLIMQIGVKPENVSGYVGLCSPGYCSAYDWGNESAWLQETIPQIGGPNLDNLTFTFIDPLNLDIHTSFASYLSVIIVLVFIGLTIVGTFCTSLFDKGEKGISPGAESHYIRFNDSQNLGSQIPSSQFSGATSQFFGLNRISSGVSSMNDSKENLDRILRDDEPKTFSQRVLQSFDASRNYDELVGKESRLDYDKNLHLWDGIKVFSLFWVILGNVFILSSTSKNSPAALYFAQNSWWFLVVTMAPYALDTFLFVSGFIAAYQLLEQFKDLPFGLVNLFKVYFHRWIRLWPVYVIIILLYWKVAPFLSSGPAWFQFVNFSQACEKTWWKNFLLLDNIITSPLKDHCMAWGISVSLEMQMFLFTPFIIWLYLKDREYGKTSIWVLILLSICAGYSFAIQSDFPYTMQVNPPPNINDIFNEVVSNPMVHWCTYFIGIYAGILYRNYRNGERNFYHWVQEHWFAGYMIVISALCALFSCLILFPRTQQKNIVQWPQSVVYGWIAAGRLFVVVCIWLLLVPALSGSMKTLKNFLSWGVFKMISHLIYPIVLVHFIVILFIYASDTQFTEFSLSKNLYMTLTVVVVSMVIAIFLYLVIERPLILIAKGLAASKLHRFSLRGLDDQTSIVKA